MREHGNISEEHLYPEIYRRFAPITEQLIREMEKQHNNIFLNEDLLQQMIDEAVRRSESDGSEAVPMSAGMDMEMGIGMGENDLRAEAVPVLYQMGRGGHHSGRRPHHGHGHGHGFNYDRGVTSDILRILFLQQIFGRRRPNWRCR